MIKKFKGYIALLIMILLFSTILVGCNSSKQSIASNKTKSAIEKIQDSGKIILGTCADYPPFEFHKQIDGKDEIVGFDIDIAKEIAKDLGVELEIKDMDFDGLLMALETENVDFVIAGMNPTDERKESVDFSKVYYDQDQGLLIRAEDKENYKTMEDLTGMKIGAQKGTTQEETVEINVKDPQLKALGKITDLVLELKNKKIDGVALALPVAEAYVEANPDLIISPYVDFGTEGGIAIALKKGNQELVDAVNITIDRLLKDNMIEKFIQDATALGEED